MVPSQKALPLPLDLSAYPREALRRGWFLTEDPMKTMPAGAATLAFIFQTVASDYPLMTGCSLELAKSRFYEARATAVAQVTPSNKASLSLPSVTRAAAPGASGTIKGKSGKSSVPGVKHQTTMALGPAFHNVIPARTMSPIYTQTPLSPSQLPIPSHLQPLVNSPILQAPVKPVFTSQRQAD